MPLCRCCSGSCSGSFWPSVGDDRLPCNVCLGDAAKSVADLLQELLAKGVAGSTSVNGRGTTNSSSMSHSNTAFGEGRAEVIPSSVLVANEVIDEVCGTCGRCSDAAGWPGRWWVEKGWWWLGWCGGWEDRGLWMASDGRLVTASACLCRSGVNASSSRGWRAVSGHLAVPADIADPTFGEPTLEPDDAMRRCSFKPGVCVLQLRIAGNVTPSCLSTVAGNDDSLARHG